MEPILISACLLGEKCTYKGGDNKADFVEELNRYFDLVPFCPEVAGGLPTPRDPSEIRGSFVIQKTKNGEKDVTSAFLDGAYKATSVCSYLGIRYAIMTENSPSCGSHKVHDGYFRKRLIDGEGITVAALRRMGVTVMNEEEGRAFLEKFKANDAKRAEATAAARARDEAKEAKKEEPKPQRRFDGNKKFPKGDRPKKPGWSYQGKTRPHASHPQKPKK